MNAEPSTRCCTLCGRGPIAGPAAMMCAACEAKRLREWNAEDAPPLKPTWQPTPMKVGACPIPGGLVAQISAAQERRRIARRNNVLIVCFCIVVIVCALGAHYVFIRSLP